MTLALTGCGGGTGIGPSGRSKTLELTGVASPQEPGWVVTSRADIQPRKKWTVLVYINGANDLETYGVLNMNQMEKIGSTEDVNMVTQFKRIAGRYDSSNGDWSDTRRFYVDRGSDAGTITSTLISQRANVDMGSAATLQEFVNWGVRTFPAERYNLVIWNHGAGWRSVKTRAQRSPVTRGVSYDDVTNNHIDTIALPGAIVHPEGKKWDLLSVDCSLMQMIEVLYEWRNTADYIVGSEESPPGEGYAYDLTMGHLVGNPTMDGRTLGIHYADDTATRFASQYGITQSVVETAKVAPIISALNELGSTLMSLKDQLDPIEPPSQPITYGTKISLAREDAQAYEYFENKDLLHFLDRLDVRITSSAALKQKTAAVRTAVKAALVRNVTTKQFTPNSQGIAAFLPTPNRYRTIDIEQANGFGQRYSLLKLAQDAGSWQSFLADGPR
jgi:Clostripain family